MKTTTQTYPRSGRPSRSRSKYGYDHRWWGESSAPRVEEAQDGYWFLTKRPLPCLAFITPFLAFYEAGVLVFGAAKSEAVRAGADAWMRHVLGAVGLTDRFLLPMVLVAALLGWAGLERRRGRFHVGVLAGMALESLVLGIALIGLSKLVDVGFARIEPLPPLSAASPHPIAPLIGYLGAGLYEEALFRLAMIPLLFYGLRLLQAPVLAANVLAVTGSALLFSLAHHAGSPGEVFTWFAFIFRWLAGIFFAWVFVARGFGIAVGAHCAYDILVGWLDWHF